MIHFTDRTRQTGEARTADAARPLIAVLDQLTQVIQGLDDLQYAQKPVGVIESSVGGHVRHCLDHVRALIDAIRTGRIDYDERKRGTDIEVSRYAATNAVERFVDVLQTLPDNRLACELDMDVLMSRDRPPLAVKTSVGREMAYVLAHTLHHNALIGAMVKTLGGSLPEYFGYAPSTLKSMEAAPCAR